MYRDRVGEELKVVPCDCIAVNPFQPRKQFCEEEIESLACSIRALGVIHPPVVRPISDERYELISGERRWRAAQKAGLTEIPVLVRPHSDEDSAQAALVENVQRVDLNPIEVARSLADLAHRFGLTQEQLADRIGKKRSTVANYLRLLTLPAEIRDSVASGEISMGHAKAILSQEGLEKQLHLFRRIVQGKLSVREAEGATVGVSRGGEAESQLYLRDLEERLRRSLGMKVAVRSRGRNGGVVAIEYSDLDGLDQVLKALGVVDE